MRNILVCFTILFSFFVGEGSASPGVSLKGNGLSFGNVRSEGEIIDGLSLTLGSSESKWFEEINGVSLSLGRAARRIKGLSISPFYAGTDDTMTGLALSPLSAYPNRLKGIALGGLHARGNITGLTIATFVGNDISHIPVFIMNIPLGILSGLLKADFTIKLPQNTEETMTGITLSAALTGGNIKGVSIAALATDAYIVNGLVAAPLNFSEELHGMQVGFFNSADVVHGVQLGGAGNFAMEEGHIQIGGTNFADSAYIQIGMFNLTNELHGIQFGALNIAANNPWYRVILPLVNWYE